MTYKELLNFLSKLSEEQLNTTVTVFTGQEFYPSEEVRIAQGADILDDGVPYICIEQ